ncbi:response regulator transcription factor [Ornithinimicrobium avium]|uniref:DNA-binding response regulator n=1 Tax=Ornithinimicrobium avium TaxID=2283195 RepID=A0A345NMV3_9MICO|nr:response regulator transcription factor [Ornithinimicrobium avium]AXH96361.1 DNA-binding response regulator [Ornithinimicrobium avium]
MRVVIAEDSALFREGLAALLVTAGHTIVGRAATAAAAVAQVRAHQPDITVLDVRMPERDEGVAAAAEIRAWEPEAPVMLLSQHVETRHCVDLATGGSFGYLLKDRVLDVDDFFVALDRVARGGTALDPEVVAQLVGAARADTELALLTPRELDVLGHMAQGLSNRAVARRLHLSARTVETHIGSIFAKLGLVDAPDEHRRVRAVLAYLSAART